MRGLISFKKVQSGDGLRLQYSDDGKGIDLGKIKSKAQSQGIDCNSKSAQELGSLIFLENLSTSDTTSDIAGRGVGMSAVKEEVETLGGTIRLMVEGSVENEEETIPPSLKLNFPNP